MGKKMREVPSVQKDFSQLTPDENRKIGSPVDISNLADLIDRVWSAGLYSGFELTDNGNGTVDIAAGEGVLRTSSSPTAPLVIIAVSGVEDLALTDNSVNYIYVDYNSGSPQILASTSVTAFDCLNKCILYKCSREGNEIHYLNLMGNNVDSNRSYRRKDFETGHIDLGSGGKVSETGTRSIAVTAASYWAILSRIATAAKDTSSSDTYDLYYRNGSGGWTKTTGNTQVSNTHYDDGSGTLDILGNKRYGARFVFATVSESGDHIAVVIGQAEHKTREEAENEPIPGDLPPEIQAVGVPLALVTVVKDGTNFASILNVMEHTFSTSLPVQHNNDSGLQGGTTNEYFHLTEAVATNLVTSSVSTSVDGNPVVFDSTTGKVVKSTTAPLMRTFLNVADNADATGFLGSYTAAQIAALTGMSAYDWVRNTDQRGRIERYNGSYWVPEVSGVKEYPHQWWGDHDFTVNPVGPDGWNMVTSGTPAIDIAEISGDSIRLKRTIGPATSVAFEKTYDISPRDTLNIGRVKVGYKMSALQATGTSSDDSAYFIVGLKTGIGDIIEARYEVDFEGSANIELYTNIGTEGVITDLWSAENWVSTSAAVPSYSQLTISDDAVICFLFGEPGEGMNSEGATVAGRRFVEGTSDITLYIKMAPNSEATAGNRQFDITVSDIFFDID